MLLLLLYLVFCTVIIYIKIQHLNSFINFRPCAAVEDEEKKREVITYTIRGAGECIDHSLLDRYKNIYDNANKDDPSFITLPYEGPGTDPTNSKSFLNDLNSSLPNTNDINSPPINYDLYPPLSPLPRYLLSDEIGTSSAPATIQCLANHEDTQRPAIPLHMRPIKRPNSASSLKIELQDDQTKETYIRSTVRPWTKHPRWVIRLSEPKRTYTPALSISRASSQERRTNSVNSSIRSTSTIPRYAFYEE